jgi:curved DNA-binding protein CbpA
MNLESLNTNPMVPGLGANFAVPTYYDILNVDRAASKFTIRESYLRLKNLYANGGDGLYGVVGANDLSRHLQELEVAFEVLNDDTRRATYDRSLTQTGLERSENIRVAPAAGENREPSPGFAGAEVVQTNRSVLRVTRIHAPGSADNTLQTKMLSIIEEGDIGDGSILIALRESAGVGHAEMQERTKISLEYIRNMEANQFDRLPKVVYVKGFMRSYLRYLSVPNSEKIVTAYIARLEAYQAGQK